MMVAENNVKFILNCFTLTRGSNFEGGSNAKLISATKYFNTSLAFFSHSKSFLKGSENYILTMPS